jgi:aminoglycoside 3-N-acetyltransferase
MSNKGVVNRVLSLSPYAELVIRNIYWSNINFFTSLSKRWKKKKVASKSTLTDFSKILNFLKSYGVKEGTILIVHSSFDALENTKKSPKIIIEDLIKTVGPTGTIAMNSARKLKGNNEIVNYLKEDVDEVPLTYDVRNSKVWTGVLPFFMVRNSVAEISRFPVNPMVAIGFHAKKMMENNLTGDLKACGINSSWNYCVENNAIVVGIGIDLVHSLTIMHVAEDSHDGWPVANWYRKRKYKIIDCNFEKEIEVSERRSKWGALCFAERTLCKDLIDNNILTSTEIDGVVVEVLKSKDLIIFLNSKNHNGYPYFCI